MSNADTPIGRIIQVVLHDEATNQLEETHQTEGVRQPAHKAEGARQPAHEAEGARQPAHDAVDVTVLSDSISASSPLGPVSPLIDSFSLGSTDMDISCIDMSLETGKYIVNTCKGTVGAQIMCPF